MSIDPGVLLTVCNAGLQALQVCGSLDGMLGVGELAVAACIAQVDDDGAGLALGLSTHLLCQIALQQSRDLCTGVGQEGQGEHQQTGG